MAKKRRKHGVSFGTVLSVLLMVAVLGGCGYVAVRIVGDQIDATSFIQVLTDGIKIPGLSRDGETPVQGASVGATPAPIKYVDTTAVATQTPVPAPTMRSVSVQAVGSIAAPKNVRQSVYSKESETYDFSEIFEAVRPVLTRGDLTIAVSETAFAGKEAGYANFSAPSELLDALKYAGVDLLSLGTERALEKGYSGLTESIAQIESRGFIVCGAYAEEESVGKAQIFQINDVTIAVLGYSYGLSDDSKSKTKSVHRFSVPIIDLERMRTDIVNARKEGAEVVIVLPHWGTKNKRATPDNVKSTARSLAQAGADIILGSHPNVVQGVEKITSVRSDGASHDSYVAYSLGSFLTDSRDDANTAGMVLSLDFEVDPQTRALTLHEPTFVPTYLARTKVDGSYQYAIYPSASDEIRGTVDSGTQKAMDKALESVKQAIGDQFVFE